MSVPGVLVFSWFERFRVWDFGSSGLQGLKLRGFGVSGFGASGLQELRVSGVWCFRVSEHRDCRFRASGFRGSKIPGFWATGSQWKTR